MTFKKKNCIYLEVRISANVEMENKRTNNIILF